MTAISVAERIFIVYLTVINLIGLFQMAADKHSARLHRRRIPEAALFAVALLGGSLGTLGGMYFFRHKTKHWSFRIGIPLILAAQLVAFYYIYRTGLLSGI